MIYKAAIGSRLTNKDAQCYGNHIETLIEQRGGTMIAADIVNDARDADSPLHDFFEWNDGSAAVLYRADQARYLLRSIYVVVRRDNNEDMIRAFYNNLVPVAESGDVERVYVTVSRVMNEVDLREQVIAQALAQLVSWQKRYKQYKEFTSIVAVIEEVTMN